MSSVDNVESLSIDETNALRIKLGLKPLYSDPSQSNAQNDQSKSENAVKYSADTEVTYVAPVIESKKAIEIERRLNERLNRKARSQLISGPSLAQSLNDDPLDPLVWAQRQRNKQKLASKRTFVTYSDDEIDESKNTNSDKIIDDTTLDPEAQLKVVHEYNNLQTNSVLTLCDTGILEAQDEGVDDIDYLQSAELVDKERLDRNNSIRKAKAVSYEDYVSKAMDDSGQKNILEKYDEVIEENKGGGFANFIKGFFIGKPKASKPDLANDTEIVIGSRTDSLTRTDNSRTNGTSNGISDNTNIERQNKIIKKSIPKISKRSKVPDWDQLFNGDSNSPSSASTALVKSLTSSNQPMPTIDIKPRKIQNYMSNDDIDNILYQQLTKQRRIARNIQSQTNNSVKLENIKTDQYQVKYEISQVDEFCKYVHNNNHNDKKYKSSVQSTVEASQPPSLDSTNPLEEQPLDMGIANTLEYLKTKGKSNFKLGQLQPANHENDDIKLNYIDKYGKTMTPKQAFKELCYTFHGKMPGKNKQEKRLRKLEMELRLLQNPTNSLPTMRALKQNQKSDKCAHFVLDGNNNSR